MIVDVQFEDETVQIARIIHEHGDMYAVNFLEKENNVYNFSLDTELVPKDAISGFYDVENLEETELYVKVPGGYDLLDDSEDEDYVCSEEDESESDSESDISLEDEDDEA
jgi:hypothetical protein